MDNKAFKNLITKEVTKILKEQFDSSSSSPRPLSDEARELQLYIVNDGQLYKQAQSIMTNLRKKIKRGVYDPEKAVDLWMYLATAGAKKYMKEYGSPNGRIQDIFPKSVRYNVAQLLADDYEEELQDGLNECSSKGPKQLDESRECEICGAKAKGHSSEPRCAEHCSEEGEDRRITDQYPKKVWTKKKKVKTEQNSRFEGDKRMSDEDPMADFDTSEFYDDEDPYDVFDGMDVMGPEGTETFDRDKHVR